jgi:hypothetical protein
MGRHRTGRHMLVSARQAVVVEVQYSTFDFQSTSQCTHIHTNSTQRQLGHVNADHPWTVRLLAYTNTVPLVEALKQSRHHPLPLPALPSHHALPMVVHRPPLRLPQSLAMIPSHPYRTLSLLPNRAPFKRVRARV